MNPWFRMMLVLPLLISLLACQAQAMRPGELTYEPTASQPFGLPNPEAPAQLDQFAFMIGRNDCMEERLNNASGEWEAGSRTWDAHYYLNGNAIRDTGRSGNATNGNIRVYDAASDKWHVTFFSSPIYGTGVWSGGLVEDRIELEQPQQAPGTEIDGINRLTFFEISDTAFRWKGEWVSLDGSVVFPYWRIACQKRR